MPVAAPTDALLVEFWTAVIVAAEAAPAPMTWLTLRMGALHLGSVSDQGIRYFVAIPAAATDDRIAVSAPALPVRAAIK